MLKLHRWLSWSSRAVAGVMVLAALPAPGALQGQEREEGERKRWSGPGLLWDEAGRARPATPTDALRLLEEWADRPDQSYGLAIDPTVAVLTQRYERRARPELDELADAMIRMILADDTSEGRVREELGWALVSASRTGDPGWEQGGAAYEGAFDRLRQVYETLAARALAGGGPDPFYVLYEDYSDENWYRREALFGALVRLYLADPEGRGREYMLSIIARGRPEGVPSGSYSRVVRGLGEAAPGGPGVAARPRRLRPELSLPEAQPARADGQAPTVSRLRAVIGGRTAARRPSSPSRPAATDRLGFRTRRRFLALRLARSGGSARSIATRFSGRPSVASSRGPPRAAPPARG